MGTETLSSLRLAIVGAAAREAAPFTGAKSPFVNRNGKTVQEVAGGTTIARVFESAGWQLTPGMRDALRQGFWIRQTQGYGPEDPAPYARADLADCMSAVTMVKKDGISWCGLWARWVLEKAGYQASWVNRQLSPAPYEFTRREKGDSAWKALELKPGDVGIIPGRVHHVILVAEVSGGRFEVCEGNMGPPTFVWHRAGTPKTVVSKNDFGAVWQVQD